PAVEPVGRDLRRALRVLPASTRVCRHRRRAAGGVRHPGIRRPRERTRLRSARGESAPRRGPARLFAAVARGDRRGGDSPGCAAAHAGVARRRLRGALRLRCARGLPPPAGGARPVVGPRRLSDDERRALTSIAHQTALALEKARLHSQLEAKMEELQRTQHQLIQADKLKALGTLLSGVAHELNNPLSAVLVAASLLKLKYRPSDAARAPLDVIERQCVRAARIVGELLAFARRTPPERRQVDPNEVLRAAPSLEAPEFDLNQIRVITALDPLPTIWADPPQLQQVLLNLLTNATHAMKSAGRDGVLTVRSTVHAGEITIVVEDNGPGIAPEHLGQVFDPFFTTKPTGEGTGLGLSVSIGIVEAHGGRMSVENVPTGGARFTIQLPVGQGVEVLAAPAPRPAATRSAHILVVEDERSLRDVLVEVLATLGHQVAAAPTGTAAIRLLERDTYDVVLLDLVLPDIDGQGVWQWIRTHRPGLASRVIFMTGDTIRVGSQRFLRE